MKMAKASEDDIEAAMELMGILNAVDDGYYPSKDDAPDTDPIFFDPNKKEHLAAFHAKIKACMDKSPGFISRVVGGMHTIMHNDILDPNDDCIALHPRFLAKTS